MGSFSKLKEILFKRDNFLLIGHEFPDGDCLGSLLAMGEALKSSNKSVKLVCKDEIPQVFNFMEGHESIDNDFLLGNYEVVILLDNGDFQRTGFAKRLINFKKKEIPIVNIDHHPKNDIWKFADVNYVDTGVSSTSELIYDIFVGLNIEITPKIATYLLTGIFTDTGGFKHTNTSGKVFEITSHLLSKGAKLKAVSKNFFNEKSISSLRLWGKALSRLTLNRDLGVIYSVLSQKDIKEANASEDEVSGLVNLINTSPESAVALLLYETSGSKIRGSFRTESDKIDVSLLAKHLGGGGHKKAAGFNLSGKLKRLNDSWIIE